MRFNPTRYLGKRYGLLTGGLSKRIDGITHVECTCDCGNVCTVRSGALDPDWQLGNRRGTGSCGCLRKRPNRPCHVRNRKHPTHSHLLAQYLDGAKTRGHEWKLDADTFTKLVTGNCHYCGSPPTERKAPTYTYAGNGIDRINPDRGYVWDNVVSCCTRCNFAKGSMRYDEFIAWVRIVAATTAGN